MSAKHMGQVFDLALTPPQTLVLLAMADHADHRGERIYPSVGLIASKTGYHPRHVQKIIQQLLGLHAMELQTAATGRPGVTNHYRLTFDGLATKPHADHDDDAETGGILTPLPPRRVASDAETGGILCKTGGILCKTGGTQATLIIKESSKEPSGESNARHPSLPPVTIEREEEDDPEDLTSISVIERPATTWTPRQTRLIAFAAKHGAVLDHPTLGDLRKEWLAELDSPGLTLEEAEGAFAAAGEHCLPSHWRRHAPSAQERQARAEVVAQRKRDAEYLIRRDQEKAAWRDLCARVMGQKAVAT